jgi:hypothetical protein
MNRNFNEKLSSHEVSELTRLRKSKLIEKP